MENNQQQIDELFKTAFQSLPDSQPAGAWDTPSEAVWNNVQKEIAQPSGTTGGASLLLWAAMLSLAALAGWFAYSAFLAPKPVAAPSTTTPVAVPATVPAVAAPAPPSNSVAQPAATQAESQKAPETRQKPAVSSARTPKTANPATEPAIEQLPPPVADPRNNLERRKGGQE